MNRKNKEYESNQERSYKHKPYGVKGSGWSSKDNAIVYFMDKKSARQKSKQEINNQIKDNEEYEEYLKIKWIEFLNM